MKFGGTSVGDIDKIKKAAERIKKEISQGNAVVAVVSAMAGETNRLIELVKMTAEDYNLEEYGVTLVDQNDRLTVDKLNSKLVRENIPTVKIVSWRSAITAPIAKGNSNLNQM